MATNKVTNGSSKARRGRPGRRYIGRRFLIGTDVIGEWLQDETGRVTLAFRAADKDESGPALFEAAAVRVRPPELPPKLRGKLLATNGARLPVSGPFPVRR